YLQYAAVRANNIIKKATEAGIDVGEESIRKCVAAAGVDSHLTGSAAADEIWELLYSASRLDEITSQVITALEPASLAKYTFTLAQQFNLFYHRYRILAETDPERRMFYLSVVQVVRRVMDRALDMMGMQVPQRM